MMDGINHGWEMGWGWGMIVGLVGLAVLGIVVWAIVKVVNKKSNPK